MSLSCLETLVGLSSRDCNCTSGSRPSGYNTSDSGYYLDDREYGLPVQDALIASTECGESSIWSLMAEAKTQAIRDFKVDLQQALSDERRNNIINWRGTIAKAEATTYVNRTSGTAGIQLLPRKRYRDAEFVIKAIWVGLNATKTFDVTVSSNDSSFSSVTRSVNATAGTWVRNELDTVVTLPMYSIARTDVRYNFTYSLDGAKCYQNRGWCCSKPQWMNHFSFGGILESGSFSDDNLYSAAYGYGLALEGYFTCNKLDWICNLTEMNGLDFRNLLGRQLQMKGAIKLMSAVLESGKVNYYSLLDQEGLMMRRNKLQKMYAENMAWIAQNMPYNISSCWGCDKHAPEVVPMLV